MLQSSDIRYLTINDKTIENIKKLTYLRSTITKNTTLDQKLSMQVGKASTIEELPPQHPHQCPSV